jgi:hypothetical protein
MGLTFAEFLQALYESLGGEEIPQGLSDSAPINLASTMPMRIGRPERQIDLEEAIAASQAVDEDYIGDEDDPCLPRRSPMYARADAPRFPQSSALC